MVDKTGAYRDCLRSACRRANRCADPEISCFKLFRNEMREAAIPLLPALRAAAEKAKLGDEES